MVRLVAASETTDENGEPIYVFKLDRTRRIERSLYALGSAIVALIVAAETAPFVLGWEDPPEDWEHWMSILVALSVVLFSYQALLYGSRGERVVVSQSALSFHPGRKLTDFENPSPLEIALSRVEKLETSAVKTVIYASSSTTTIPAGLADPGELVWAISKMAGRRIPTVHTEEKPSLLNS